MHSCPAPWENGIHNRLARQMWAKMIIHLCISGKFFVISTMCWFNHGFDLLLIYECIICSIMEIDVSWTRIKFGKRFFHKSMFDFIRLSSWTNRWKSSPDKSGFMNAMGKRKCSHILFIPNSIRIYLSKWKLWELF